MFGSANLRPCLFAGSSHKKLADEIVRYLGMSEGKVALSHFPDGEISVEILESVRGKDVFVLQSVALKPNEYLMELLIMVDALKRASANSIVAILPYYGYARQDRKDKPRVPITAKLVADLLVKAGVTRLLTMDLHAGQIQGFFDIPVDNLPGRVVLTKTIQDLGLENWTVVGPDVGSVKTARLFAAKLGVDFGVVDKHRVSPTTVDRSTLIGNVKDKVVLLADDMISTGRTLFSAAKACQEKGARRIIACATHGLFMGDSIELIEKSPIELVYVTDTIPNGPRLAGSTKIRTVSVAQYFAQAIQCILTAESFAPLFE